EEKGYGADELDRREVNLAKGENYDPTYLRINGAGAVPTLVVPMDRYIGPEIESRYKSISDVSKILDFLDKSRTVVSRTHTTSHSPAPALAPATVDGLNKSTAIIELVHSPALDLEFLYLSAKSADELARKAQGEEGAYLRQRFARLSDALNPPANTAIPDPNEPAPSLTARSRSLLEAKHALYAGYLKAYDSVAATPSSGDVQEFVSKGKSTWETGIKAALDAMEQTIKVSHVAVGEESQDNRSEAAQEKGSIPAQPPASAAAPTSTTGTDGSAHPAGLILGEQLSLADLHLFPWLARAVELSGGGLTVEGITKLEAQINAPVGERIKWFWEAMLQRESVKKIY
ncbi:hypothetical protein FRB99_002837, partial [Tulasnella sp. 403]